MSRMFLNYDVYYFISIMFKSNKSILSNLYCSMALGD